jgi:glucose/arabinose dehydrogenase
MIGGRDARLQRPRSSIGLPVSCAAVVLCALQACTVPSVMPAAERTGATPTLPPPEQALLPTVHIAPALGWVDGGQPRAAPGSQVQAFARGLDHPRWLLTLPNGDVLVAESNAPAKPDGAVGLRARIMGWVMKRAGAGVPSADRITLLRDVDGDGQADVRSVFADQLHSPFGMALVGDQLYVANTDAVVRLPYTTGELKAAGPPVTVTPLPAGPINHHWTKNLVADPDGKALYVTVGSNSNVGENGLEAEAGRAAIWRVDLATGAKALYATGLRNPNGMAWEPRRQALWTVVNERDELGNDLVPDYLTEVVADGFYGWPYGYWGAHIDRRVDPARPDLLARSRVPDYALGAHVAALGLAWSAHSRLPDASAGGMYVAEHGSWNRQPFSGYQVVFVPFADGHPSGSPQTVLDGFVGADGRARGRPVGVALDARGALLVADDVGNTIWRVSARAP